MSSKRLSPRMQESEKVQRCDFPNCKAACCVYGSWVDKGHVAEILEKAKMILPHMPEEHQNPELWFDLKEEDRWWCAADPGWITGHSYIVYAPLINGATVIMYEGAPNHPYPNSTHYNQGTAIGHKPSHTLSLVHLH